MNKTEGQRLIKIYEDAIARKREDITELKDEVLGVRKRMGEKPVRFFHDGWEIIKRQLKEFHRDS